MLILSYSELLGFASITCWLGAQFPQVIENIRRQSCEGLALPFLANWLLGDISNLIGCILTHQLPFQTWLATYFVAVDCTLVIQYFYYYKPAKAHPSIHSHLRSATLPSTRRLSIERGASRYRTLSAVASNVAAAAALAAQQGEAQSDFPHTPRYLRRPSHPPGQTASGSQVRDSEYMEEQEPPPGMMESFYSEGGRDTGVKRVSWSIERHAGRAASVGPSRIRTLGLAPTGPSTITSPEEMREEHPVEMEASIESLAPTIVTARGTRANRRGSTMVFLGVWALFGFGALSGTQHGGMSSRVTGVGRVLWSPHVAERTPQLAVEDGELLPRDTPTLDFGRIEVKLEGQSSILGNPEDDEPPADSPSSQQILGRFFAWLCTTLYLTSRLPQIWKNYVRKSVEGLSMYLFIFAFLGNSFYVASILSSPQLSAAPKESAKFLRQSIPYLLGSAGTLMFDITIVSQSFCYRPRQHRRHGTLAYTRVGDEEEAALLSGDALAAHLSADSPSVTNRGRTSRTRTNTT